MSEPVYETAADSVHVAAEHTAPSQKHGPSNGERISAAQTHEVRPTANVTTATANVAQDPGGTLATVLCRRCGTMNPPHRERCRRCNSYLVANQVARKYPKLAPDDVLLTADELLAG